MADRKSAIKKRELLNELGVSDTAITEYLINNWMSGEDADQALEDLLSENDYYTEDDDEDDDDSDEDDFTVIG
jgi:hypothetical protein